MRYTVLFFISLISLFACNTDSKRQVLQGEVFGSTFSVVYYGGENYETAIGSIFDSLNASLSTYDTNALISKINRNETDSLDRFLSQLLEQSCDIYQKTHYYFDPTVAPLVELYGFGNKEPSGFPGKDEVAAVREYVGFQKLSWDESRLLKSHPNVQLNFNSIAPGYTADRVGAFLEAKGVKSYMVEIGGEIMAKGTKPDGSLWVIGIDVPEKERGTLYGKVKLQNEGLATSGNYRKFRIDSLSNKKYVHTIDPIEVTANPSDLLSVTVVSKTATQADAYATAFMAMGKEKSLNLLNKLRDVKVLLIYSDSLGKYQHQSLNGFRLD